MSVRILIGDMRERLKELPDASVDSCVSDPPYHLTSIVKRFGAANAATAKVGKTGAYARASKGFMGQTWDGGDVAFDPATWAEVLRVLKPGAHLVAFSGTRTYHRMVCAIEDAGFEVRDMLSWNFGSGFPKSHNVVKALAASGLACTCPKTIVSHHCVSDENLHDLRNGLAAHDALPVGEESDVREVMLGSPDRPEASRSPTESAAVVPMRDVRETGASPAFTPDAECFGLLQPVVPIQDVRGSTPPDGGEHEGPQPGSAVRGKEPGMERRGDAQAAEGKLQRRSVCSSAGMGAANGADGRLHNGASAGDGADVRLPAYQNGSREPHRSQPIEQPPEQSGALADERRPQAWGGWPVCSGCSKPIVPEGFGTALKPAHEPICLARKPLIGSVAANVLRFGTGAINIDGCRIETSEGLGRFNNPKPVEHRVNDSHPNAKPLGRMQQTAGLIDNSGGLGRWPANIIHDGSEEVLAGFPDVTTHGGGASSTGFWSPNDTTRPIGPGDSGSAARFFYCAKATTAERGEGNTHPTVKPVDLMRWLCRLVTPKGGTVLDPFMGSGSTMIAADAEQFNGIGCELSPEYAAIAETRIRDAAGMFAEVLAA